MNEELFIINEKMTEYNISFTSTLSINRTLSSSIGRNTYMRYAQAIYIAILVCLGVCGNILCVIVFSTKSLRRIRSSAFLFTLALTDTFFLLDLLPGMIHTAFFSNLYRKMNIICNIQTYISFVASFVHIWMVLAFTAERFFAVNFPLKHMSQCTPDVSRTIIGIILIPPMICYIHPAFFVSEVDERGQCREKDNYERYLNNLNTFDTIMTMFVPFILVSILNILIIRKLFCSSTFRQHVFANGSRYQCRRTSNWNQPSNPPEIRSYHSQRMIRSLRLSNAQRKLSLYRTFTNSELSPMNNINGNISNEQILSNNIKGKTTFSRKNESAQRHILTELRLTKMLLAISLICLLLNFPSYYLRFMFLYEKSQEPSSSENNYSNEIDLAFYRDMIFHYMSYISYSINLFIYLLFGGNFRRALKRLVLLTPDNINSTLRGKRLYDNEHTYDNDSIGGTLTSTNSSLRSHSKLSEQTGLHLKVRQQPIQITQENKT